MTNVESPPTKRLVRPSALASFKPPNIARVFSSMASSSPACFKNAYTNFQDDLCAFLLFLVVPDYPENTHENSV